MMSISSGPNHWFVSPRANPEAETRLFLFPYAGGGPTVFNKWDSGFPDQVAIYIAHYPGRGSRHHESPIRQIATLAQNFSQAMRPLLDKPFAFFGHSMGSLVAFEISRRLRQQNFPLPQILFVSGCGAPHLPDPNQVIHKDPDPEFIKSLQELKGIPSEFLQQPEVMQLLLPLLRADFEATECYQYIPENIPLPVPIVAFAGSEDPRVSRDRLEGWDSHTDVAFKSRYFPGDHFFINTCREAVIASITAELIS